jgi:hypothetical protein
MPNFANRTQASSARANQRRSNTRASPTNPRGDASASPSPLSAQVRPADMDASMAPAKSQSAASAAKSKQTEDAKSKAARQAIEQRLAATQLSGISRATQSTTVAGGSSHRQSASSTAGPMADEIPPLTQRSRRARVYSHSDITSDSKAPPASKKQEDKGKGTARDQGTRSPSSILAWTHFHWPQSATPRPRTPS